MGLTLHKRVCAYGRGPLGVPPKERSDCLGELII